MIRERIAIVPEERAQPMYRLWHCFDCGLQFSMLTLELPRLCPRCTTSFGGVIVPRKDNCPCCGYPECGHKH